MSNWKPIDTAPRDCEILIARPRCARIAKWDDDRHNRKPRPFWNDRSPHGMAYMRNSPPKYWQPIPPLPPDP